MEIVGDCRCRLSVIPFCVAHDALFVLGNSFPLVELAKSIIIASGCGTQTHESTTGGYELCMLYEPYDESNGRVNHLVMFVISGKKNYWPPPHGSNNQFGQSEHETSHRD